ncbi:MAG: hypothetical protein ACE5JX_09720, partial [Acidobacteriota bacterium]
MSVWSAVTAGCGDCDQRTAVRLPRGPLHEFCVPLYAPDYARSVLLAAQAVASSLIPPHGIEV